MARIKIRKKKKGEPEWLVQRRIAKQRKYDRKMTKQFVKMNVFPHSTVRDIWPEAFDERENQ